MAAAPPDIGPVTERELVEQVNTGRKAEELLNEPLIIRWFADVDATIIECLRRCDPRDARELAHWAAMLEAQTLQKKAFATYMQTGNIAASQLKQQSLVRRRISQWKWAPVKPDAA